jgi:hypothetical protein
VSVEHHKLRRAFGQFLAAKRALRQGYQESGASHGPAESIRVIETRAAGQARDHSVMSEELHGLRDENERLRKSLALLHTYSVRVQEQRDILAVQRDKLLDACETATTWLRDDDRAEEDPTQLLGQLDNALGGFSGPYLFG